MQAVSLQHMDGTVQLTITDASLGQPQYFVFIYKPGQESGVIKAIYALIFDQYIELNFGHYVSELVDLYALTVEMQQRDQHTDSMTSRMLNHIYRILEVIKSTVAGACDLFRCK